ncbi:nucleoprotein TPR-like isoform X2 [Pomacea canaliculata]|uniref:nucleoprotein TPR-like isoform X2 n=1 Tax=Pomacea canaliculata TaxID=400727 RepID=UPI000D73798D|nr:nucleoprotein TPR-like isoform X2 [Pomacea canaliculata]
MAGKDLLETSLDADDLQSLSPSTREKLEGLISSLTLQRNEITAKYEKLRVNSEQQYFELEKQHIDTSSQLEAERHGKEDLSNRLAELEKKYNETTNELKELSSKYEKIQVEQRELSSANQLLQAEKRDLASFMETRDKNIDRLKDEIKELSEALAKANKEKCDTQAELMKVQAEEVSQKYREKRLQQEKEQLQQQVNWLSDQLSEKTKEFVTFRREKASRLMELQGQVEEKTEEITHHLATIEALKTSKEEQASKIESLIQKLKEARDLQTQSDEQFRQELAAQSKLYALYKDASEENNGKITELTRAVEELQRLLKEASTAYSNLEIAKGEEESKLKDELREKDLKIESLDEELRNANDLLAAKRAGVLKFTEDEMANLFPLAATTSKLLKKGMTLTEIYSSYVQAVENLEQQKEENERLSSYLDQIVQEIEDKAPLLKKQREDYETALQTLDQLTPKLDSAMLECEKMRAECDDTKRRSSFFQRENVRLQQQNADLSRQVRYLVKEIQEMKGGCVVQDDEAEVSSTQDSSSASRVITQHMVTFRNIEELQEKNQQLLEAIRDLSTQKEQEESLATDARVVELQKQLEEATKELDDLRSARSRQAEMVEAIVRQRDMYRVLLQQGSMSPISPSLPPLTSTPAQGALASPLLSQAPPLVSVDTEKKLQEVQMALKELQAEYSTYRKEKLENEKILNEQLEKCRADLSETRMQNARLSSQLDHSAERYKILQGNAEGYRKEIAALQDRCQKSSTTMAKLELTIIQLKEEVYEKQQAASTWEAKVDHLHMQYDTLRSHEQRLVAELESMRREQQSQALLNASLQAIQNNLERAEFETKARYTNQIDYMEKQVAMLQKKLEMAEDDKNNKVQALETKLASKQEELTKVLSGQEQLKVEAAKAKDDMQAAMQELSATEAKLAAAENRLSSIGSLGEDEFKEELKDLKSSKEMLERRLKNMSEQLKQAREQEKQYQVIAQSVEEKLRQSNQTSREFQEMCETRVLDAQNAKALLEKRVEELEEAHQKQLNENIRLAEDSHNLNNELRKQLTSLRHELQETVQMREAAVVNLEAAQKACQEQTKLASEAEDKYQRELMLHAADMDALTALKKRLESYNDDLIKAQEAVKAEQNKLLDAQTSWQEQERILHAECQLLEARNVELEQQNKTLHAQMETLSKQAISLQEKAAEDPLNMSFSDENSKTNEQLLEVIRFLRREKEIAETKLQVIESSSNRMKQTVESLERQLEEANVALSEERQHSQMNTQTMSEHAALMRRVENLNVLTDSNKLLREERDRLQAQNQELDVKVRKLEADISPLQAQLRELTAQKEAVELEKDSLAGEVERWKSRTHHLVEQSNKTDPEEHRKLVVEKDQMRKQLAQTKEELFKVKAELSKVNATLSNRESELANLKQETTKLREEMQNVKQQLEDELKESEKKNVTATQLRKIGRKYKDQWESTVKELEDLRKTAAGQQQSSSEHEQNEIRKMEQAHSETREKLVAVEQAQKAAEERQAVVERERDEAKAKVTEMEKECDELKMKVAQCEAELNSQKMQLETVQQEMSQVQGSRQGLEEEQKRLQSEHASLEEKHNQSRKVLANAKTRITQQKEQLDRITTEYNELKRKLADSGQISKEESDLRVASLKSQYDHRVSLLERDLEAQRAESDAAASAADLQQQVMQLQQERDRLIVENTELSMKVQQLHRQVEMLPKTGQAQPTQPMPRQAPSSGTSPTPTEAPKMASIKPVATAATTSTMQHSSSTQAKAMASIRPMAIAPANTSTSTTVPQHPSSSSTPPMAAVMPTTMAQQEQNDDLPSTSGMQQQTTSSIPAASVTGRPQQQVQIVQPQMESTGDLLEESSVQAVVIPNIQEPAPAQVLPQQQTQTQPGTTPSTTPPSAATPSTSVEMQPLPGSSSQLGKRSRDDGDTSEEGDAKRSKVTQEAAVIPTITITDENAKVVTHIEPQTQTLQESDRGQGISVTTSTTDLGQAGCQETPQQIFEQQEDERVLCQVQEVQEGPVEEEQGGDGDVIVVGSDEEEVETNMQVSATLEYEVGQDQEVEDESDEDADSEDEQIDEGGEFDEDQENDVDEEDDNDVVIIDIDENEQQDSQIPVGQGETSTVTGAVSSPRPPPPLQPVPHTERLPSTSRSQLTPFLLGQGGPFDDDDCTVPSTPTLSLPRRTDGFAEALNSPHVSQRFVFSGGVEVPVQPELAQLESQRALGMDDTRMDLSQFDDAGGRSMSSTPTPLQMSAGAALEATAVTAAVTAAPAGQSQETSGITSSYPGLFLGQGEGQPSAPESSEQQMDLTSESSQGQEDASATTTQASLAEGGMGDEEESKSTSRPRIQRIVWEDSGSNSASSTTTQSSAPAPASTSGQQQQQQQQQSSQRPPASARSRGLRRGATPTRARPPMVWRGGPRGGGQQQQHPPRGMGARHPSRGMYRGQF